MDIMTKTNIVTFLHSGDMGDCIAGMAAVKQYCDIHNTKARIVFDATGGKTNRHVLRQAPNGNKFGRAQAEFLKPLLEIQPYIEEVVIDDTGDTSGIDIDLNSFRDVFGAYNSNLQFLHQYALKLPVGYTGPWIEVGDGPKDQGVLFCRSLRYQSAHVAIECVIQALNKADVPYSFCGTDLEYSAFCDCFRESKASRLYASNALDLAKIVSSHNQIIVNGTLAYWIAVSTGHPKITHEMGVDITTTFFNPAKPHPHVVYIVGAHAISGAAPADKTDKSDKTEKSENLNTDSNRSN